MKFLGDTHSNLGSLIPLFWISSDVSSFQNQQGRPILHLTDLHILAFIRGILTNLIPILQVHLRL